MAPVLALMDGPARALLQVAANGAWQGVVLVALVGVVLRLLRATNAATRHSIWWACLVAVVALPALAIVGPRAFGRWLDPVSAGAFDGAGGTAFLTLPGGEWPPFAAAALLLASSVLLLRVFGGYRSMQCLKASSAPPGESEAAVLRELLEHHPSTRPVELRISDRISSPITAGLLNPMILLPEVLLARLTTEELEHILLHELTHLRRGDDWWMLLQRICEAAFFYSPAVRWAGRRIDLEREVACDDRVIALTGRRKAYARCLMHLAELAPGQRPSLAAGALLTRNQLVRRITLMLDRRRTIHDRVSRRFTAAAMLVLGAAALYFAGQDPLIGLPSADDGAVAGDHADFGGEEGPLASGVHAGGEDGALSAVGGTASPDGAGLPRSAVEGGTIDRTAGSAPRTSPPASRVVAEAGDARGAPDRRGAEVRTASEPLLGVPRAQVQDASTSGPANARPPLTAPASRSRAAATTPPVGAAAATLPGTPTEWNAGGAPFGNATPLAEGALEDEASEPLPLGGFTGGDGVQGGGAVGGDLTGGGGPAPSEPDSTSPADDIGLLGPPPRPKSFP